MPTNSPKPDIRFIVNVETNDTYESFKAHAVYMVDPDPRPYNENDAGVRNPQDTDREPLASLAHFAITAQRSADPTGDDWYAWRICYERPYCIELGDAERMVKFLRSVTKKLAKLEERYGSPESLAAFCARVADVLDCQQSRVWGTYHRELRADGTHYQFTDVDSLRYRLARVRTDA